MIKYAKVSKWEIGAYRANGTDQRTQNLSVTVAVISYIHQNNFFLGGNVAKEN